MIFYLISVIIKVIQEDVFMKKALVLLILVLISVGVFADSQIKERRNFPKYMYLGEELKLEDYFNLKGVEKVTMQIRIDQSLYAPKIAAENLDQDVADAYNKQIGDQTVAVNEKFRILNLKADTKVLSAEKPGNADVTFTFYFENDKKGQDTKSYNVSVITFDGKEIKSLSKRFNAHKILIARLVTCLIIFIIIVLIVISYIMKNYKLVKKTGSAPKKPLNPKE